MSSPTGIVKNKKQKQNTQRAVLPVRSSQAGQITHSAVLCHKPVTT